MKGPSLATPSGMRNGVYGARRSSLLTHPSVVRPQASVLCNLMILNRSQVFAAHEYGGYLQIATSRRGGLVASTIEQLNKNSAGLIAEAVRLVRESERPAAPR
jgi:hypothetical protein